MSQEKAREYLRALGLEDRIRVTEEDTATVATAAAAFGIAPAQIAKTLSFLVNGEAVLVVAEGTARVDNRKFKDAFGVKAKMIAPDQVEALVGHAPGGVCPFGILPGVRVWLDGSLRRHHRVYPAAGDGHTAVDLTVEELEYAADPLGWVDVTKDPEAE